MIDRTDIYSSSTFYLIGFSFAISALALALLWIRRRSILDQWLMVVACALMTELAIVVFFGTGRFTVGFYAGRIFSLTTATVVLAALLTDTTRLYVRLARSNEMLKRERDSKLMNLQAITASISHEVRQPLATISTNGGAALRFLGMVPPNLEEARSALKGILRDSHRASEIFESIRSLFERADLETEPIDMNRVALEVLRDLRGELQGNGVTVGTELSSELPLVMGHRGQLQEVLHNLVQNAIDAMSAIKDGGRVLRVGTALHGRGAIVVSVKDSGPGLDPKNMDGIFDAFVTTKSCGTGLGLAISRMIVERHQGHLSASTDNESGALFELVLPIRHPNYAAGTSG